MGKVHQANFNWRHLFVNHYAPSRRIQWMFPLVFFKDVFSFRLFSTNLIWRWGAGRLTDSQSERNVFTGWRVFKKSFPIKIEKKEKDFNKVSLLELQTGGFWDVLTKLHHISTTRKYWSCLVSFFFFSSSLSQRKSENQTSWVYWREFGQ